MTRLLVLGAAPLPHERQHRQVAANLRTWHFSRPLLDGGHEIRLVAVRVPRAYAEGTPPILQEEDGRLEYFSLSPDRFEKSEYLQELFEEFEPDAVIGVNTYPSSRAVRLVTDRPIWCDLNGWIMAEAQTKAHVYGEDGYVSHFWNMERAVLERADAISTVSVAQAHATVGELAVLGRLGRRNHGYELVHTIPNAVRQVDPVPVEECRRVVRGSLVPEDAFVVLWVGGYNTWTDVELLFTGLSTAMEANPSLHFVSTGGAVEGHDDITFTRFRRRAETSPFASRFHFVGWVPTADVPLYYRDSDLGVNVDGLNYETVYGARNRINEMMGAGLPVLTTLGTEVSREVAEAGACLTTEVGNARGFAEQLSWAASSRDALLEMGRKGRSLVERLYSYERTTRPVCKWAAAPARAPDRGERIVFQDLDLYGSDNGTGGASAERLDLQGRLAVVEDHLSQQQLRSGVLESRLQEAQQQLGEIHESRMWRLWMTYHRLTGWLRR